MELIRIIFYGFFLLLINITVSAQPVVTKHAMVVTEQRIASQIGIDILRSGGNAIDAAVAVGYALAVVYPCCGNIGGGGFMLIHLANGKDVFLNFREKAPLKARKDLFLDAAGQVKPDQSTKGYLAVAVPGTVMGLETALKRYGSMTRAQVMSPAIKLAKQGYIVTAHDAKRLANFTNYFRNQPNVAAIFLQQGQPYRAGERFIQSDLANTLTLIEQQGPDVFYNGLIAKAIVNASHKQGGILTLQDFASYQVEELTPVRCHYRNLTIISAPPPSSGGVTLCEMLNILNNFPLEQLGFRSVTSVRIIIEAMRDAFTDRNTKLGDPNFVKNPIKQLLATDYAAALSQQIKIHPSFNPHTQIEFHEQSQTTHYSIVDNKGNAVAVTYTLNGYFGAKVIADHTGFFLNDEMDDFTIKPGVPNKFGLVQYDKNAIQPGKRPLSSMTPTLVMKSGHLFVVLGSPGGPRIITSVLLTLLNVIDYDMSIQQAVNTPRFHYQVFPNEIDIEPFALFFLTINRLTSMGYHFASQKNWSAVEAILLDSNHLLHGANDDRRPDGAAIGY